MIREQSSKEAVSIGDVAMKIGVTTRTLRYWEEVGLLAPIQRPDGATRGYGADDIERARFILNLKELGLSIGEIQGLCKAYGDADRAERTIPSLVALLDRHTGQLDEKMAQLASLRKEIVEYRQRMRDRLSAGGKAKGPLALP